MLKAQKTLTEGTTTGKHSDISTPEPSHKPNITHANNNPTYESSLRTTAPKEIIHYTDPTITKYYTVDSYNITNLQSEIATRTQLLELFDSLEIPMVEVKCYTNQTALLETSRHLAAHVLTQLPLRSGFPCMRMKEIPGTRNESFISPNRNYNPPSTFSTSTLSDTNTHPNPYNTTAQILEPSNQANTPYKRNDSNEITYTSMEPNSEQLTTLNTETPERTKPHNKPHRL
ncbi:hypothetical protein FQA39_LY01631 [Lamprigera yunnana]|nr:hypothetical protein FQA39_LY01631 [Lamprigera yunnana]